MIKMLCESGFFPILLTLAAFWFGQALQSKWKSPLLNPILVASVIIIAVLTAFKIPVETYQSGCAPLQFLLTPATICFAIGMYEQLGKLKKHIAAILAGILCGTVSSLAFIRLLCAAFGLDIVLTISLLPKSITTAIGMALSEEAGGIASLTTAAIVVTGVLGNMFGPTLCRMFGIKNDIAAGAAFGTSSHAIGTARAVQISELAGAVSSLSLTFAGLITVVLFQLFTI